MAPKKAMSKGSKRASETTTNVPQAKKAKIDPVQEKVDMVCAALEDSDYEISCRDTLIAIAPYALTAAKNERHSYQDTMLGVLGEVFDAQMTTQQRRLALEQEVFDGVDSERNDRQVAKEAAESELQAKNEEIQEAEKVLEADGVSVMEAETDLQKTTNEHIDAEASLGKNSAEKERCINAQKDNFEPLKQGSWEKPAEQKRHINALKPLFKKELACDDSLTSALQSALGKKPEERGSFDLMVCQQLEDALVKHIQSLDEKLNNFDTELAEKKAALEGAQAVLDAAKEKQSSSSEALEKLKEEKKHKQEALKKAKQTVVEYKPSVIEAKGNLDIQQMFVEQLQERIDALKYLLERESHPESVEAEEEIAPEMEVESTQKPEVTFQEVVGKVEPVVQPQVEMIMAAGA